MRLNPKFPSTPAAIGEIKFAAAKKIMKNDLKRLEKYTSVQAPTSFFMEGQHAYPDKKDVALAFIGKAGINMRNYGKFEVAKMETGVLGRVYFNGQNADGQKVIVFDIAKGKGKQKIAKLEKGLKKLIAQTTFQLVFNEVSESAYDELEQQLDAAPDIVETPDMAEDSDDSGDVEVEATQDYGRLLSSNLAKLSAQFVAIKAKVSAKMPVEKDDFELLYDYALEWLELYDESPVFAKTKYIGQRPQVEGIRDFAQARINGKTMIVAKGFDGLEEGQSRGISDPNTLNQIFQTSQGFDKKGLCAEASRAMLYKYLDLNKMMKTDGNINIADGLASNDVDNTSPYFVDTMGMNGEHGKGTNYYPILKEGKGHAHDKANYTVDVAHAQKALQYIEYHLSQQPAIPVMVGVSYKNFVSTGGNKYNDLTTDHFILLVGMRKKGGVGEYFYLDPGTSHKNIGTDIAANSMLQDAKNPFLFIDPKSAIGSGSPFFLSAVAKFAKDRGNDNWAQEWDAKNGVEVEQNEPKAAPAPIRPEAVQFDLAANIGSIPPAKLQVLREILAAAGEAKAKITSYSRSATEQARLMYNNIIKDGEARNRSSYKNPAAASLVVDAFINAAKQKKADSEVLAAVLAAVNQVGAANLSDHCGANPAIDIDPKSLKNSTNFQQFLKKDSRATAIYPPTDATYHILIK